MNNAAAAVQRKFTGNFTQQAPLPQAALTAAAEVLATGRLHRYNLVPGETGTVAALEAAYRDWQGSTYCLAVTSGGQALQIALRAVGVKPGDAVLTNAFTLAPVPGAIAALGGKPELVEIDANLRLDLDDLAARIARSTAKVLLVSHMRGHLCDMDRLMQICDAAGVTVIEDCAHTMGASWNGRKSGNFGAIGCFSTQTYKHINSGEGGLLTTDDPEIAARATIMSGSYMLYPRHGAGPDDAAFARARYEMPNLSARMDALRAALLIPQLEALDHSIAAWNARYDACAQALRACNGLHLPQRPAAERMVGSSIQFRAPGLDANGCRALIDAAAARGVELKWFGAGDPAGFTSAHASWRYVDPQALPQTDRIMATLFDMRIPLSFSVLDCAFIGELIGEAYREISA